MKPLFLKPACIITLLFMQHVCFSQWIENFSDSNFSANPRWTGDTSFWKINAAHQLQSNCTIPNNSFYLSTSSTSASAVQWYIETDLAFNPSSLNVVDIYLMSSDSNLLNNSFNGYFVRIGNTDDEISLYRRIGNNITKIIDGENAVLNQSASHIKLLITRNNQSLFTLKRAINSDSYVNEGMVVDSSVQSSIAFGMLVKQSTASFFGKHFFNSIAIQPFVRDTIPPALQSLLIVDSNKIDLVFNEPIDSTNASNIANYQISASGEFPVLASRDNQQTQTIHLLFAHQLTARQIQYLAVMNIQDDALNTIIPTTYSFIRYTPAVYDILIDELMSDPTPVKNLPDAEWIELRNNTVFDIDLSEWTLKKKDESSGPMPHYILKPDSLVLITSSGNVNELSHFAPVLSVSSFPALTNSNDTISLLSPNGSYIHTVAYSDEWYHNAVKKNGGWSLEMIDLNNPCGGEDNWTASINETGGTPGKMNSVDAMNIDHAVPELMRAFADDSLRVHLYFNEPMDSLEASKVGNFWINNGIGYPVKATPLPPMFDQVVLSLPTALQPQQTYTISTDHIFDCIGNIIEDKNKAIVGLFENADSNDIVINEILFNPTLGGYDYVELYNRSSKIINLSTLFLAHPLLDGNMDDICPISPSGLLIFPGEYYVLSEGLRELERNYWVLNPAHLLSMSSMPSMNDDEGAIILIDQNANKIDLVRYHQNQHFELLENKEGVSLERISSEKKSCDLQNWHSASSTSGYGTPTAKNSQSYTAQNNQDMISISPQVVSPNNDGVDDLLNIQYQFPENGYAATITIFDMNGKPIVCPVRNALCGYSGFFFWDGLNEKKQKIASGMYILLLEAIRSNGKKVQCKKSFAIRN